MKKCVFNFFFFLFIASLAVNCNDFHLIWEKNKSFKLQSNELFSLSHKSIIVDYTPVEGCIVCNEHGQFRDEKCVFFLAFTHTIEKKIIFDENVNFKYVLLLLDFCQYIHLKEFHVQASRFWDSRWNKNGPCVFSLWCHRQLWSLRSNHEYFHIEMDGCHLENWQLKITTHENWWPQKLNRPFRIIERKSPTKSTFDVYLGRKWRQKHMLSIEKKFIEEIMPIAIINLFKLCN